MGYYIVRGGKTIGGEFAVRGSKNAALPILAACVLAEDEVSAYTGRFPHA